MVSRRQSVQLGITWLALPAASLRAQAQISLALALNRAARLRALSQRSTKLYAQIVLDVLATNARETQAQVQKLIAVSFEDLARASLSGAAAAQLGLATQASAALAGGLSAAHSKESLLRVNGLADRMLGEADKLTGLIESTAKQGSAKLINVAGRQRMLSQRLAKNYYLAAAGLESAASRGQLGTDRTEFKEALKTMNAAPVSTNAIRADLQLLEGQWLFFESALARKADAESMKIVATTSERLLEVSNNLTTQYETALRDVLGVT